MTRLMVIGDTIDWDDDQKDVYAAPFGRRRDSRSCRLMVIGDTIDWDDDQKDVYAAQFGRRTIISLHPALAGEGLMLIGDTIDWDDDQKDVYRHFQVDASSCIFLLWCFFRYYRRLDEQDQYEPVGLDDSMEDKRDLDQIMADRRAVPDGDDDEVEGEDLFNDNYMEDYR